MECGIHSNFQFMPPQRRRQMGAGDTGNPTPSSSSNKTTVLPWPPMMQNPFLSDPTLGSAIGIPPHLIGTCHSKHRWPPHQLTEPRGRVWRWSTTIMTVKSAATIKRYEWSAKLEPPLLTLLYHLLQHLLLTGEGLWDGKWLYWGWPPSLVRKHRAGLRLHIQRGPRERTRSGAGSTPGTGYHRRRWAPTCKSQTCQQFLYRPRQPQRDPLSSAEVLVQPIHHDQLDCLWRHRPRDQTTCFRRIQDRDRPSSVCQGHRLGEV